MRSYATSSCWTYYWPLQLSSLILNKPQAQCNWILPIESWTHSVHTIYFNVVLLTISVIWYCFWNSVFQLFIFVCSFVLNISLCWKIIQKCTFNGFWYHTNLPLIIHQNVLIVVKRTAIVGIGFVIQYQSQNARWGKKLKQQRCEQNRKKSNLNDIMGNRISLLWFVCGTQCATRWTFL